MSLELRKFKLKKVLFKQSVLWSGWIRERFLRSKSNHWLGCFSWNSKRKQKAKLKILEFDNYLSRFLEFPQRILDQESGWRQAVAFDKVDCGLDSWPGEGKLWLKFDRSSLNGFIVTSRSPRGSSKIIRYREIEWLDANFDCRWKVWKSNLKELKVSQASHTGDNLASR